VSSFNNKKKNGIQIPYNYDRAINAIIQIKFGLIFKLNLIKVTLLNLTNY